MHIVKYTLTLQRSESGYINETNNNTETGCAKSTKKLKLLIV